eukprot:SM000082S22819  [mRNA]  locus=s82:169969:172213:- [translate_table: standard]
MALTSLLIGMKAAVQRQSRNKMPAHCSAISGGCTVQPTSAIELSLERNQMELCGDTSNVTVVAVYLEEHKLVTDIQDAHMEAVAQDTASAICIRKSHKHMQHDHDLMGFNTLVQDVGDKAESNSTGSHGDLEQVKIPGLVAAGDSEESQEEVLHGEGKGPQKVQQVAAVKSAEIEKLTWVQQWVKAMGSPDDYNEDDSDMQLKIEEGVQPQHDIAEELANVCPLGSDMEVTREPMGLGKIELVRGNRQYYAESSASAGYRSGVHLTEATAAAFTMSLEHRATQAQWSARQLKEVPCMVSFRYLKHLDLSFNRIGALKRGVLPKSLHTLDLSYNSISVIEGLRDLTHLRCIVLTGNCITRIGHSLGHCVSLREVDLSNNKISDVEGLHRLLKLRVLDLSGNKITTTKGLGQLAANHGSLLALNVLDNPVMTLVGEEAIRRTLGGLLPRLMLLNE